MSDEERQLVLRAREGDREAFGALVERHWARLVRLARSVVGEMTAEDAVQEGLLTCWRKIRGLADPEAFGAWATRIVFRLCLRHGRRARFDVPVEAVPVPGRPADPEETLWVAEVLAALAPRQRAVMHLTAVEGCSDREVGELLGITAGSVRAHRRRARERIGSMKGGASHGQEKGSVGLRTRVS